MSEPAIVFFFGRGITYYDYVMRYSLVITEYYYYAIPVFWTGLNFSFLSFGRKLYADYTESVSSAHFSTAKCRAAFSTQTNHSFLTATEPGKPCRDGYDLCRVSGMRIGIMEPIMQCFGA